MENSEEIRMTSSSRRVRGWLSASGMIGVFSLLVGRLAATPLGWLGSFCGAAIAVCLARRWPTSPLGRWLGAARWLWSLPVMAVTLRICTKSVTAYSYPGWDYVVPAALVLLLKEPMLRLFGASDTTYPYAERYFTVYISGSVFALLSTGMNQFIIAQGYAKIGMISVIIGAIMNIALDPLFIFVFHMGVEGAALATILSQAVSACFVLYFLLKKARVRISFGGYDLSVMGRVLKLGVAPFTIIAADNIMIIAKNALLQKYGGAQGDTLISCNTIVQSFMLVVTMPLSGISGGTQSIISYNFGACRSDRVLKAQKFIIGLCIGYTTLLFVMARLAGSAFAALFTSDAALNEAACRAIRICTLAIIPLGAQYAIVDGFTAMGQVQMSLPLSFWRKTVYFVALFLIPKFADASKIFYAEPISDVMCVMLSVPLYLALIGKILRRREQIMQEN